jgi:hypothetical protein
MAHMALECRRDDDDDEAFLRTFVLPYEDWPSFLQLKGHTGEHRWFRASNVIPMEKYRATTVRPLPAGDRIT